MSSITQLQPITPATGRGLTRKQLWCLAAIAPLAVAPVWFCLPVEPFRFSPTMTGLLLTLLLAAATITDLNHRKIYNWTTYPIFAWALLINLAPWLGLPSAAVGLSHSLIGAGVCFLIMLIPYSLARGGAGDVKLATAIGALVGLDAGLLVIGFAYIIAAVAILGWTCLTQGPLNLISAMWRRLAGHWLPHVTTPSQQQTKLLQQPIPLAGFFLLATLAVVMGLPDWLRNL